jgi:hypothetical protein
MIKVPPEEDTSPGLGFPSKEVHNAYGPVHKWMYMLGNLPLLNFNRGEDDQALECFRV